MYAYSKNSLAKLATVHLDLRILFEEVIKYFDNTILYGNRSVEEQQDLFKQGRELQHGIWVVVNPKRVVTYCDGIYIPSKHNSFPATAIDATPYPIEWDNLKRIHYFAGFVMGLAEQLYIDNEITHRVRWGADWNLNYKTEDEKFVDLPHFELIM